MIARVGIDSDSLLDFADEPRRATNIQSDLVEILHDYGYLELAGTNDSKALLATVERLSPDLRALWAHALRDLHTLNRVGFGDGEAPMRDVCVAGELPSGLRSRVDIVIVREALAAIRGVPPEKGYARRGLEPEISLLDSVRHSSTLKGLRSMRLRGSFAKGVDRNELWREVFEKSAALSTEVTILDRYFLTHLLAARKGNRDHHEWLIQKLDQTMRPRAAVRVVAELPRGRGSTAADRQPGAASATAEEIVRNSLGPLIGAGRIGELHIVVARWPQRWEGGPHNRHIRFSCGVAVSASEGLDHLDTPTLQSPFTWQAALSAERIGALSADEQVILQKRDRLEIRVPTVVVADTPKSIAGDDALNGPDENTAGLPASQVDF